MLIDRCSVSRIGLETNTRSDHLKMEYINIKFKE